jgi:SAM-dependent methyltransferase
VNALETKLDCLLDLALSRILDGDVAEPLHLLCDELRTLCREVPTEEWLGELAPACRRHPLHALLLQDPYTRRAFEKPRGYAGDAEMLDFIYSGIPPQGTTYLGQEIFRVTAGGANAQSVLARRDILAAQINEVTQRQERPLILSVGCGHLREAQHAAALRSGWRGTLFALDQDERSLAVVAREQKGHGVEPIRCSVTSLLRGQQRWKGLDLVYASGLFDYLPAERAVCLTRTLFDMLGPGGRLLIANFTPDNHGRGYMEAFMEWQLIFRDEADMETLASSVPAARIARQTIYPEGNGNIVFLEMDLDG